MPIYMDRHDIPKEVTAEHVALMHQTDLKIEHKFNCRGITYWCDEVRGNAFCLIEAPNKKAIQNMHNEAHGGYPHSIIEVDTKLVESFLGRIKDPVNSEKAALHIIDDPAFRIIMVIETSNYLNRLEGNQLSVFFQKFHNSVSKSVKRFSGSIVKKDNNSYLVSFKLVSDAMDCAVDIQNKFKYVTPKFDAVNRKLKISLSCGTPVTDKKNIFEETILEATRMCEIVEGKLIISSAVKLLYEKEHKNAILNKALVRSLKPSEEKFLNDLMNYVEANWNNQNSNVNIICEELGLSKSQLYRKLVKLTGKSINGFIREFRLHKALDLLHKRHGNISEIAYESGFNSPEYFSKCFMDKYGILPSKYIQQHLQ